MYKWYYLGVVYDIDFNWEKNQLLKATRNVGFTEAIDALDDGGFLSFIAHPSQKYPHQKLLVVEIEEYAYSIPCVINEVEKKIFFKTLYPSRLLTKKYLKKLV
jgi:hypothetical protein